MKARFGTLWMLLMICRFGMAGEPASAPAAKPDLSTMTTPALPFPAVADLKPVPDPDPLVFLDGRKVKTKEDWQARKKEIMDLLQHYIYGFSPPEKLVDGAPPPEVTKEEKDESISFWVLLVGAVIVGSGTAGIIAFIKKVRSSPTVQ